MAGISHLSVASSVVAVRLLLPTLGTVSLVAGVGLQLGGCGGAQSASEDPAEAAEAAWLRAERLYNRGDYELARVRYGEIYQSFPYSQYAPLSELRIADCHFGEGSYARAIEAYQRFGRFHPRHAEVEYAEFRVAEAYMEQLPSEFWVFPPSYEKDLREASNARNTLLTFLQTWPETSRRGPAETMLQRVTDLLADHELYVARFYLGRENPRAAANRASYLLAQFPQATRVPDALFVQARAMLMLDEVDTAVAALRSLRDTHPDTEAGRRAAEYLTEYGL